MVPGARVEGLVAQDLEGETLVYDRVRHRAHCLNPTASLVWRLCDGRRSVTEISEQVARETGLPADPAIVELALRRLRRAHLLDEPEGEWCEAPITRRQLARRLGLVGALSTLLPAVQSLVAPTPAQAAATCGSLGDRCGQLTDPGCYPPLACIGGKCR